MFFGGSWGWNWVGSNKECVKEYCIVGLVEKGWIV